MNARDWLAIFVLAFLFGSSFFFTEIATPELGPITIAASRLVIGGAVLVIWLSLRPSAAKMPTLSQVAMLGFFNSVVPITLIAWAQHDLASGIASILAATSPIFGAIFAHLFATGERLTRLRVLGTLLAFAGVILIVDPAALTRLDGVLAPLAVLAAAMSSAAAGVFGKRVLGDVSPPAAATGQVVAAALMAVTLSAVFEQPWKRPFPGTAAVTAVVAMGILSTALAYRLFFHLLGRAGAANTLLVGFLVPVFATVLGVVLLGERLSLLEVVGLIGVLFSLFIIDKARYRGPVHCTR